MTSTSLRGRATTGPMGRLRAIWQHGDALYRLIMIIAAALTWLLVVGVGWQLWLNSELSRTSSASTFLSEQQLGSRPGVSSPPSRSCTAP